MSFMTKFLILFFLGAITGSFFYTLAMRFLDGSVKESPKKALLSRSKCPHCEEAINPLFLIPLLGFTFLRGRCRKCRAKISLFYPAAEITSGLLLILMVHLWGLSLLTIAGFLIAEISLCISIIDIKSMTIPNSLIIVFLCIALFTVVLEQDYSRHLYGLAAALILFIAVMLIFPGSFGGGDVKLAAAIGFYCGLSLFMVAIETALISGTIIGLTYIAVKKKSLKSRIPFAPFLSGGLITAMFFGQEIILLYRAFMR